jgi:predicted dehydrogenase
MGVNIGGNHILAFQAHDAFQVVAIAARHQECPLEAAQCYDIPHAIAGYEPMEKTRWRSWRA